MPPQKLLISLKKATVFHQGKSLMKSLSWDLRTQEHWCFLGGNGAGKSLLAGLLCGRYSTGEESMLWHDDLSLKDIVNVSFDSVQETLDWQRRYDESEFIEGGVDHGTLLGDFILDGLSQAELPIDNITLLSLNDDLSTGVKYLSNGEMRKAQLLRALLKKPRLLILDALYEGLDQQSCVALRQLLMKTATEGEIQLIHCVQDVNEIPEYTTHLLLLDECRKLLSGMRPVVEKDRLFAKLFKEPPPALSSLPQSYAVKDSIPQGQEIVRMEKLSVTYGEHRVLHEIDWTVKAGECWGISGPNGAGKTTLLSIVSADNPQSYGKELWLFGRKRGSGETIWDIKKRIGVVTTELQLNYHKHIKAEEVVVSGFFDSIGLYQRAENSQYTIAREWMELLNVADLAKLSFNSLSYGERRAVLLARAMVKSPDILILDEPCQGLDARNRQSLLQTVEFLAKNTAMTILYVSHKAEAQLSCLTHFLSFDKQDDGIYQYGIKEA